MTAEPTHPGLMSPRALAREEYDPADDADRCPGCGGVGVLHTSVCPRDRQVS